MIIQQYVKAIRKSRLTCKHSITHAKITFAISVKKLTLMGLNLKFPSTFDIYTSIGCNRSKTTKNAKNLQRQTHLKTDKFATQAKQRNYQLGLSRRSNSKIDKLNSIGIPVSQPGCSHRRPKTR